MDRKITYNLKERYSNLPPENEQKPKLQQPIAEETVKPKLKLKSNTSSPTLKTVIKEGAGKQGIEEKLDRLLLEFEQLKTMHTKLLTENNIIPKGSQEMYLQVNGHLFKGDMELIEKQ